MITRNDFAAIDTEIKQVITTTLDDLRIANLNGYLLFLADAEYKPEYDSPHSNLNPNVIENKMDWYKDEARIRFLAEFLSTFYHFKVPQTETDDNIQRLHMELMIYSHIWEAKPFLKKLYRLAHLTNGEDYAWSVTIDDMGKHKFIRDDIRQAFQDNDNAIADIIRSGFHTSLRNAFAHSEYWFDTMNDHNRIILDNFKDAYPGELDQVSFNEWSRRFVYSALFSYHFFHIAHLKRQSLVADTGTHIYTIQLPNKCGGSTSAVEIIYRQQHDAFGFHTGN